VLDRVRRHQPLSALAASTAAAAAASSASVAAALRPAAAAAAAANPLNEAEVKRAAFFYMDR